MTMLHGKMTFDSLAKRRSPGARAARLASAPWRQVAAADAPMIDPILQALR